MRVGITSSKADFDAEFNPRFGRCEHFIIVDTETHAWEALPNPAADARGGAGPLAAQFIANQRIKAIISGRYGPSAHSALQAGGVQTYIGEGATVKDVLDKFLAGELQQVMAETGPGFHGRGRRR
jgi:predicted Fe-Mo cluster-binding NifX family protein